MIQPIYLLNGPNLNLLGEREPDVYGSSSLSDVESRCQRLAEQEGIRMVFRQSNHEGELVDWIQEARQNASGVIINAGAYTHTSVAIHDALLALELPIIELHISNVFKREEFRQHSYISKPATAVMCGFGVEGYELAILGIKRLLKGRLAA